ncbi:beta-lactamase [Seminavis robusta]|uniref:Beta-lactamase n=1 Tax=Seminavis robusta TaxID=568900 RepID=A0A9N8E5D7_9STRA|nr:beta-lactamase [Seminavis robusta]|eukprot:Sro669_g184510.1 beta-lactamase (395) ;mRNA; r:18410-19594
MINRMSSMMRMIFICSLMGAISVPLVSATPVDLSAEWQVDPKYNANEAYCELQNMVGVNSIMAYAIIKDGNIIAEGYGEGRSAAGIYQPWSVTKSIANIIIGLMITNGDVAANDTLATIFPDPNDWINVSDAPAKMTLKLSELMSFTSGLTRGGLIIGYATLREELASLMYEEENRETWIYLRDDHIFSWIIYKVTGMTPRQYALSLDFFTKLGINETEYNWGTFGVEPLKLETTAHSFQTNVRQLAKFGQLYLQGGVAAPGGEQLIAPSWITESTTSQPEEGYPQGYLWYPTSRGYEARGIFGQYISVIPSRNIVIAALRRDCIGSSRGFIDAAHSRLDKLDNGVDGACPESLWDRVVPDWAKVGMSLVTESVFGDDQSSLDYYPSNHHLRSP